MVSSRTFSMFAAIIVRYEATTAKVVNGGVGLRQQTRVLKKKKKKGVEETRGDYSFYREFVVENAETKKEKGES